jgi:hypothetical protein
MTLPLVIVGFAAVFFLLGMLAGRSRQASSNRRYQQELLDAFASGFLCGYRSGKP